MKQKIDYTNGAATWAPRLPPAALQLLRRAGLSVPLDGTISMHTVDFALRNWSLQERMYAKGLLRDCRLIER